MHFAACVWTSSSCSLLRHFGSYDVGVDTDECAAASLHPFPSFSLAVVWCLQPSQCKLWWSHSLHSGHHLHSTSLKCHRHLLLNTETWRIDQKHHTCFMEGKKQPQICVYLRCEAFFFFSHWKHGNCPFRPSLCFMNVGLCIFTSKPKSDERPVFILSAYRMMFVILTACSRIRSAARQLICRLSYLASLTDVIKSLPDYQDNKKRIFFP